MALRQQCGETADESTPLGITGLRRGLGDRQLGFELGQFAARARADRQAAREFRQTSEFMLAVPG